jgi:hypothetical protein
VVWIDDEKGWTVKTLSIKEDGTMWLIPANENLKPYINRTRYFLE